MCPPRGDRHLATAERRPEPGLRPVSGGVAPSDCLEGRAGDRCVPRGRGGGAASLSGAVALAVPSCGRSDWVTGPRSQTLRMGKKGRKTTETGSGGGGSRERKREAGGGEGPRAHPLQPAAPRLFFCFLILYLTRNLWEKFDGSWQPPRSPASGRAAACGRQDRGRRRASPAPPWASGAAPHSEASAGPRPSPAARWCHSSPGIAASGLSRCHTLCRSSEPGRSTRALPAPGGAPGSEDAGLGAAGRPAQARQASPSSRGPSARGPRARRQRTGKDCP